jgi:glycosyltransferase involved in cell wall biosynthesis
MSGMRVLALTHVFPRSAADPAAPFLLRWACALQAAGAPVAVVAPHDAGLPARHRVAGVEVRRARYAPDRWEVLAYRGQMHQQVRTAAGPPLLASLVATLSAAVRAQLRAGAPDVLHVHWWLPGAVVARLARPRVPVVVTVHGTDVALLEGRPRLAALARWALAAADRVEAVSGDLAERLERATGRPVDAVGPMPLAPVAAPATTPALALAGRGAAGDGAAGSSPDGAWDRPLAVLGVGRLVADKGFGDLLEAVARLRLPAAVTILGDGPLRAALAARARQLGLALTLPGQVPPEEVAAAYAAADVVVQPSLREGLGLVAAEALAAGVPVVATDSGGVRDLLARDELVAPGDVDGLAAALRCVADDPARARRSAQDRGDAVRARYAPAAVAARTLSAYRLLA